MNIKRIEYLKEFLTEQMNHWMLFPLALTFMGLDRELTGMHKPDLPFWFFLSVIPLIFFVFRCMFKRFYLFALQHIAVMGIVIFISKPGSMHGIISVSFTFLYALLSLFLLLKKKTVYCDPIQLPVGVIISAVAMALQWWHYEGQDSWDTYYFMALIASIALFFIIFYLQRYLDFLVVNRSSTGYLPASEMLRSGLGLAVGYTLFGTAILIVSTHFGWFSKIAQYIANVILGIFKWIFSGLPKVESEVIPEVTDWYGDVITPELPQNETFWLWNIIGKIVGYIFLLAIAYVTVKFLIRFLKWLQNFMFYHKPSEDLQEDEVYDEREPCDVEKEFGKKKLSFFTALSPREKIRKLYKKRLLSAAIVMPERESARLEYETAREWERKLETEGMADIYEQARYSRREVTAADVKKMRYACRNR